MAVKESQVKLFDVAKADTLVVTVNLIGAMGRGVADELRIRHPDAFYWYAKLCREKKFKRGNLVLLKLEDNPRYVILFPTKIHFKDKSDVSLIKAGLAKLPAVVEHLKSLGYGNHIAIPPLGCGNGWLDYADIGPIMKESLDKIDCDFTICL